MAKHISQAYASYVHYSFSQVHNFTPVKWTMRPLCTWMTAFNLDCHWSTALNTSLTITIRQHVHLPASKHLKLQIAFGNPPNGAARYSCQMFNFSWTFARPRDAFLTAYQLSYTLNNILFCSNSPWSSTTSLAFNQVRLVNFVQKIFNRADSPLLVWKFFTNTFCTNSFSWRTSLIEHFSS